MLSNVLGVQIAVIMFKACHTAAVTNAGRRMSSCEPSVAACQFSGIWPRISGNFFGERSPLSGDLRGAGHSATEELTLLTVILLQKTKQAPEEWGQALSVTAESSVTNKLLKRSAVSMCVKQQISHWTNSVL